MDKLEKRIQNLRAELDEVEQPDKEKIWAGIQHRQGLTPRSDAHHLRRSFWMGVAASIAALLVLGGGWWTFKHFSTAPKEVAVNLPPQWRQEEQRYQQLIADKMQALRLENIDKKAYGDVLQELQQLDSMQTEFKQELPALPKDDRTIQTLLRYYEQKIRILELLSKEIQIQNNEKERSNQQSS